MKAMRAERLAGRGALGLGVLRHKGDWQSGGAGRVEDDQQGDKSAMTVPLFLNGRVEMILDLESTERNSFEGAGPGGGSGVGGGLRADLRGALAPGDRDGADEPD
jgi:hypothetical protein